MQAQDARRAVVVTALSEGIHEQRVAGIIPAALLRLGPLADAVLHALHKHEQQEYERAMKALVRDTIADLAHEPWDKP